jgi:transcriptional pleiotropic regulator of transition state genes
VSNTINGNHRDMTAYGASATVTRHVDALGRVVLPAELRRAAGIRPGDAISFSLSQETIAIARMEPHCVLCEGEDKLLERHGKWICSACLSPDA